MPVVHLDVEIDHLLFDPENPRLPEDVGPGQPEIFAYLVNEIGVDDLLSSMSSGGLIAADPIIVRSAGGADYFVIEGNRRLAALKLLYGERLPRNVPSPRVPQLDAGATIPFNAIPVETNWSPVALAAYLGYKHVTSTREWTPEAKARFVLKSAGGDLSNENLRKYARQFGTTLPVLKRWLVALLALQQAQQRGLFSPEEAQARRYFGTFYTLLGSEEVQQFLGLPAGVANNPVPEPNERNLQEFLTWVAGTRNSPPVINSRDQKELESVLSSPKALEHFRDRKNLEAALIYTEIREDEIATRLRSAAYNVEACMPKLRDVRHNDKVKDAFSQLVTAVRNAQWNMKEPEGADSI